MKKMLKKIKNRAGLTLTEMLVTVAILSLFSAACLTGMTTALSVRRDNIMANDAEVLASMVTNYITNELRTASDITETGDHLTYVSNEMGYKFTMKLSDKVGEEGQLVALRGSLTDDENTLHVFSSAAYSDQTVRRLKILDLQFDLDSGKGTVNVSFKIGYDNVDGTGEPVSISTADTNFTVRLMNYEAPDSGEPGPTGG